MSLSLAFVLFLGIGFPLLLSIAILLVAYRPVLVQRVTNGISLIVGILWTTLLLRTGLPAHILGGTTSPFLPEYRWGFLAGGGTGIFLALGLLLMVLLSTKWHRVEELPLLSLSIVATIVALGAASQSLLAGGILLLGIIWLALDGRAKSAWPTAIWWLVPLMLHSAATFFPEATVPLPWLSAAAMFYLAPLAAARWLGGEAARQMLARVIPLAVGGAILQMAAPLSAQWSPALVLMALAFLALAVLYGWWQWGRPLPMASAVAAGAAAILLGVAATGGDVTALAPTVAGATAVLYLAPSAPRLARLYYVPTLAGLLAVAALAGLPFVRGGAVLTVWWQDALADGRIIEGGLIIIGLALWLAQALRLAWAPAAKQQAEAGGVPLTSRSIGANIALFLPVPAFVAFTGALPGSAMAFIPLAAGTVLFFGRNRLSQRSKAEPPRLPGGALWRDIGTGARLVGSSIVTTLREAAAVLEGESGLLWLLLLVLAFWLAS